VSLRQRLLALLSGPDDSADSDALIEVATVPLANGPLLVSALEARGLHATGCETFSVVTRTLSDYRIVVPSHEGPRAQAVVDRFLSGESP
jgi:hypothetical protein